MDESVGLLDKINFRFIIFITAGLLMLAFSLALSLYSPASTDVLRI